MINDEDEQDLFRRFASWLLTNSGPNDWHRTAMHWNWDAELTFLNWIVSQSQCDKATALTVFWKAQPEHFLRYRGDRSAVRHGHDQFDLVIKVRDLWRAGFYTRSELAFDLEDEYRRDFEALEREFGGQVEADMSLDMRGSIPGRRLELEDYIDGIPRRFWGDLD